MEKDILIEMKAKNNLLYQLAYGIMQEKGVKSFRALITDNSIYQEFITYLSFKKFPYDKKGKLRIAPKNIIRYLVCFCDYEINDYEYYFPIPLYHKVNPNMIKVEIDFDKFISMGSREVLMLESDDNPIDYFNQQEDKRVISESLKYLSPRNRKIVEMRFGLGEWEGKTNTFMEVGDRFGVSLERIRQIISQCLSALSANKFIKNHVKHETNNG